MRMSTQASQALARRDYKSRMFTMIFSDKKKLLELYNAVSGRNYNNPDLYSVMVKGKNLYGTKQIQIPAPKFIVFYNGIEEHLDHEVLRLSDAFALGDEDVSLELKADMLNINLGHNEELMETCKTLRDYSEYVYRVRKYAKDNSVEDAVERAINECIREGILQDFLEQHRAEAKAMSIYEYNEEEHMRMEREDAFEDGWKEGKEEGRKEANIQMFLLIEKMVDAGLQDAIPRLAKEPEFYKEMLNKFEL